MKTPVQEVAAALGVRFRTKILVCLFIYIYKCDLFFASLHLMLPVWHLWIKKKKVSFHFKILICESILSDRKNFKSGFVIWRGQRTIGNFLKPFTPNPALDCGIPWHHTTPAPLLPRTTSGPALWCVWPKSSWDTSCVVSQLLALEEIGLDFCKQTASGARRNGSAAEKQGPEVAAAHPLPPLPPHLPSLPLLPQLLRSPLPCVPAAVCFERAICSSSQPSDREGSGQCDGRQQPLVEKRATG